MTKTKIKHFLFAAATIAAVFTLNIYSALATAQITLTVKSPNPYEGNLSWFVYTKQPGETITDIATIKNFSNEPVNVKIYAVDAASSESGSFILSFAEDEQKGIGAWTDVKIKSTTIPPYEVIDIPFEITVPADAPPGQYLGGIVLENGLDDPEKQSGGNGTSISVKTRIGSRVYLTVPGEITENIAFTDFKAKKEITGATNFFLTLENKGNMSYEPEVRIDVYDQSGNLYETIKQPLGTIAPMTTIKPVVEMEKRPLFGNYTAKATVTFKCRFAPESLHGSAHYSEMETSFWAIPWEIVLTVLFLMFVFLTIVTEQKLARKRYFTHGEKYIVAPNEDLVSIARIRGVSWRKIARYNKMKAPYVVKAGDEIIVPKTPPQKKPEVNENATNEKK